MSGNQELDEPTPLLQSSEFQSNTQNVQSKVHEQPRIHLLRRFELDPSIHDNFPVNEETGEPIDDLSRKGYEPVQTKSTGKTLNPHVQNVQTKSVGDNCYEVTIDYDLYNWQGHLVDTTRRKKRRLSIKLFSPQPKRLPIKFPLCTNKFEGVLEEGILGMREGGIRRIIVPRGVIPKLWKDKIGDKCGVCVVKLHQFDPSNVCHHFNHQGKWLEQKDMRSSDFNTMKLKQALEKSQAECVKIKEQLRATKSKFDLLVDQIRILNAIFAASNISLPAHLFGRYT